MIANGSTEIAAVYLGSTRIDAIYKGSDVILSGTVRYAVVTDLTNITSDAPSSVEDGSGLTVTLTPNIGLTIDVNSVVVTMGGVDITATAYSAGIITIAEVTGNVSITADTIYDAEVEYLQTDGAAYINTGVKLANTTKFSLDLYVTTPDKYVQLFGGRETASTNRLYASNDSRVSGGTNTGTWYYGNRQINFTKLTAGRHTFSNTATASTLKIDSKNTAISGTITFSSTSIDFFIFTINTGSGSGALNNIAEGSRIYSGKMYSGSTLVRDYIAVRKNGVGYLYDKVSKTFFGNANSSGAFTYGNDKNS